MAEIIKKEFEINVNYSQNATTSLWSSENRGINGKITSVMLDLVNHSIDTHTGMILAHSVIRLVSRSGLLNEQTIECGVKYVENQKIDYSDLRKVYSGSKLVNNGNCDLELTITSDKDLHGNVSGKITISYTEDEGEQNTVTKLGLDQNALSDWMKTNTVNGNKGGVSSSNQFPIDFSFEQGKTVTREVLVWTNKGVTNDAIKKIAISLNIDARNNIDSQRVLEVNFNAAYGSDSYSDNIGMWILQPSALRNIQTSKTYEVGVLPNEGYCLITIKISTSQEVSGTVSGVVIVDGISQPMAVKDEDGDGSSDSVIKNIMSILDSDGYGISGGTSGTGVESDSFMSAYTDPGYKEDISNLLSDNHKQSAMSNDMASRILELEQRITSLEERMNLVGVGGNEIDWYDGGNKGVDDPWGVDDWYTKTDSRISQTEGGTEGDILCSVLYSPEPIINESVWYDSSSKGLIQFKQQFYYFNPITEGKKFKNFNYDLMWSFNLQDEKCKVILDELADSQFQFLLVFNTGDEDDEYNTAVVFDKVASSIGSDFDKWDFIDYFAKTKEYKNSFDSSKMKNKSGENYVKCMFYISRKVQSIQDYELYLKQAQEILNLITILGQKGKSFAKITGTVNYILEDEVTQKAKDKDEITITIDTQNFNGSQTLFTYDAQTNNQVLQKVEVNLVFDYEYDITQSQVCVGQALKLDFNTVATHAGFANELTSFNIGQENVSDSSKSSKQKVYKATYSTKSFANNGNCAFKIDFSTPGITSTKLADFKQHFTGKVTGTIKYTTVSK